MRTLAVSLVVLALASLAHAQATDPEAELVVAMPDDTTNMDPRIGMGSIRSTYIRQVFESLVDVDPQGKPVPGLALAWKPVSDTAWEFMLRKGVKFHDGEPFNADTVLFNLDRMFRRNLDKHGIKDVAAGTQFDKTLPYVSRWEKVDDFTVRVHTSEPAPTLWDALGREPLVPRAWTIKHGVDALNERPVGTGPWKLVEWKRKTSMLLERNETYWGTRTLARRLRLQVIPEASARLAALRAGQVSLVDAVPPLDATVLAREPAITVVSGPQKLNCRLYLNGRLRTQYDSGGKDGLYGDTKTRLALTLGVNREAIIKKIFQGYALANASPVATVSYGYAAQKGTLPYNGGFAACRTSNNLDADDFLRDWTAFTLINWTPFPPELLAAYAAQRRELDAGKRLRLLADLQRQVRDWAPVVPLYQEVKVYAQIGRVTGFVPLT